MPEFLTLKELQFLTSRVRFSKIIAELDFMNIPYKTTKLGQIRVLKSDISTFKPSTQPVQALTWQPKV